MGIERDVKTGRLTGVYRDQGNRPQDRRKRKRMTFEEAKAKAEAIIGDELDRPIEELDGWHFGERVSVIEDDEPRGVFAGDEGVLLISEVGAPEYRNVRNAFHILIDGTDCPMEVDPLNIEGAE
jgi:hypothetical protein